MRIRQIKPSWFLDKELRRGVTAECREFYIGLWMLADDAGWLDWDVSRIGAELFPYDSPKARERRIEKWSENLQTLNVGAQHLKVLACGHACVPKMAGHQRISGKTTTTVADKHRDSCRRTPGIVSQSEPKLATERGEPTSAEVSQSPPGRVGNGKERYARDGSPPKGAVAPTEFQEKVPRPFITVAKPP